MNNEKHKQPSVTCGRNSGFWICFENRYCVSVQFSPHHYCSNYGKVDTDPMQFGMWESSDAEVAILNEDLGGEFVTGNVLSQMGLNIYNDGDVAAKVCPDDIGKIIGFVQSLPALEEGKD